MTRVGHEQTFVAIRFPEEVVQVAAGMIDLDVDPDLLTGAERAELLTTVEAERSRLEALELRVLGSFDANQDYATDGTVNAATWVARLGHRTRSDAGLLVTDARKLRRHPQSLAACAEVGTQKVREFIRRVHTRVEPAYAEAETDLLAQMRNFSVDDTIILARRWVAMADQDGPEPAGERPTLSMGRTGHGLYGSFALFGEYAAFFENAIDHEADQIYRSEGDETHLPFGERRAEALLNLLRKGVGADDTTTNPAQPTVVVHITLDQLEHRLTGRIAEVDPFGHPISDTAVRRLLCDAQVHRYLTDANGVEVNLGRTKRLVESYQRLALIARDRHCQFPGCDRPPSRCHAHHIIPWEDGGPTDLANLTLLCSRHHHLCHEGGFTCRRRPDGTLEFHRPDGSVLPPQPRPG